MSTATLAGRSNSVMVTVLGLLTLLLGIACAAYGGFIIFAGGGLDVRMQDDSAAGGWAWLIRLIADFMIVIGVAILLQGVLGTLAGYGTLLRKQWGRILTFIVAVLAIPAGLLLLSGYQSSDPSYAEIAAGAAQILYGIVAQGLRITGCLPSVEIRGDGRHPTVPRQKSGVKWRPRKSDYTWLKWANCAGEVRPHESSCLPYLDCRVAASRCRAQRPAFYAR